MQTKSTKGFSINQSFDVQRAKLDNGLVVVSEKVPHVRSVSFGVFLRAGSRHETTGRRSEEHRSELQSRPHLVCRLLLEKKKKTDTTNSTKQTKKKNRTQTKSENK